MTTRITVLGAGFGGMELCTILSESLGHEVEVTLIDQSDSFIFGFSKLDVMFGHATLESVRLPYSRFVKPGVRMLRETVTVIDPATRRVTTDAGTHDADYLVVALGADYDIAATPPRRRRGVLFGGRREALARHPADLLQGKRRHRRLRCAVQVPTGAERVRADDARLPADARLA